MNIFKQFQIGLDSFFRAIPFIFKHKMGWLFLFPVLVQVALFVGGFIAVGELVDMTITFLQDQWAIDSWEFPMAEYVGTGLKALIWIIIKLTFFFIFSYFSGYVVLIILSPVLAYTSERTEAILTGKTYPFDIVQLMRDMSRGILVALRNLAIESALMLLVFVIGFIPVVNLITPFLLFFISAYYYGFSFIDYNNERQGYSFRKSIRLIRRYKSLTMGVATPFTIVLLIPFLGQMLAGFAAIIATVGGTIAYQGLLKKEAEKSR